MATDYPSDLTEAQFAVIEPDLVKVRKRTKPRTVDLRQVFNALLYILKTGCQWRMLPKEYPKWTTVYRYFNQWKQVDETGLSVLERVLKKMRWRGSYRPGEERRDGVVYRGFTKC